MPSSIRHLLNQVAARQRLAHYGVWVYRLTLALAVAFAVLLLVSRIFDWGVHWFSYSTLLAVPVLAVLLGPLFLHRVKPDAAARLVDQRMATKDLFLTTALIDSAPGAYKPLVAKRAQDRANRIRPATVVPFDWSDRTMRAGLTMLALFAATFLIPTFDLFGHGEERRKITERKEQLEVAKESAKEQIKAISNRKPTEATSQQVEQALEDLKQTFDRMDPKSPKTNLAQLNRNQRVFDDKWRKAKMQQLKNNPQKILQQFGGVKRELAENWEKQIQAGSSEGLKQEMKEIQELAKHLAKTKDGLEKKELQAKLQSRLNNLSEFMKKNANSPATNSALKQALSQLQMSNMEGLSSEALEALDQTMELSQMELESMAQTLRDLKRLEQAMDSLQLAKQLNQQQPLDGQMARECKSIGDYAKLYQQMMAQQGRMCLACQGQGGDCQTCNGTGIKGTGLGMGGSGRGRGTIAPEDSTTKTDFRPDKSSSKMQHGKILLKWKTEDEAPDGEARIEYNEALGKVEQDYSEAIVQQQVPPGLHKPIKRYFDSYLETLETDKAESK